MKEIAGKVGREAK